MVLSKRIQGQSDMNAWAASIAYHEILKFIEGVNLSVKGKLINQRQAMSSNVTKIVNLLNAMDARVNETQLEVNPQRFGNKAFHKYYVWLCDHATELCVEKLEIDPTTENLDEVATYLTESVGNSVRIDYGTGHELAFIAFLMCLFKIGFLKQPELAIGGPRIGPSTELNDYAATAFYVMPAYLSLVRHLQTYFRMEPAGSHGVWSLDDFQFIPYIWGSSQMIGTGLYEPSVIPDKDVAEKESSSCLLFSCVNYIHQVKSGPFAEHSSCLQSLGGVPNWQKVNSGMIKMYKGEVLNKFPVVQHFLFGNLLKFEPGSPEVLNSGPGSSFPDTGAALPQPRLPSTASSARSPFVKPAGDP